MERYPEGWGNKPVTWVSLEDARAYAKWAGKRLPHEWEWQYAAQGTDGRMYPWGERLESAGLFRCRIRAEPWRSAADVDAHPAGASPFGVMDMVGNVWQWTDEFTTNTPAPESCAAEATISRRARSGISRRPIATMSTANCC